MTTDPITQAREALARLIWDCDHLDRAVLFDAEKIADAILAEFRLVRRGAPAVTDEMVERATHAAYMAGLGSYLNMFALEPKIRAALEAALSTERSE